MHGTRLRRATAVGLAALVAGLAGCGGDNTAKEVAAMNTSNIQRVANLYSAHQTYKGGRGPGSEAEFRTFISQFEPAKLEMMKVNPGDLDGLFKSERDGKPFKVRYNVGGGRGSKAPVVFEQDGQNGKKQVGFTGTHEFQEVDETTYQQLWAGKTPAGSEQPVAAKGGHRPTGPPAGAPKGPQ